MFLLLDLNFAELFDILFHSHTHTHIYIYIYIYHWPIGLVSRVFTNGPRDWGSIPSRVIPKTQKMVLNTSLLNTQR